MSNDLEAKARIKINKLLEDAEWRFFDNEKGRANILLENHTTIGDLGDDFENTKNGFIDFLLVDDNQKPLVVLEAKKEKINPLTAKEQARAYAVSQKARYIILSNGNEHYLWDIENGNPERIYSFPKLSSLVLYKEYRPEPNKLVNEQINDDYIALTIMPNYKDSPDFKDESKKAQFILNNKLRFLRYYNKY